MTRLLAIALSLCALQASAQCSNPSLIENWTSCGRAIYPNTKLGQYFGVQVGDSLRMDRPLNLATGKPAQRSIRLFQCESGYRYIKAWRCDWDPLPQDQDMNHGQ